MRGGSLASIALAAILAVAPADFVSTLAQSQRVTTITAKDIAARRAELQPMLDAYIAGDPIIILQNVDGLTLSALASMLGDKEAAWNPARPAFALELAAAWFRAGHVWDVSTILRQVPIIFAIRPTPIGESAAEDTYELHCHQLALAMFEGAGLFQWHRQYLAAANPRLVKLEAANPALPTRIPLMRAIDTLMDCCEHLVLPRASVAFTLTYGSRPTSRQTPLDALARFEDAARKPNLRQEALVRGAFLHERQRQAKAGLAMINRSDPSGDKIIDYASALIRGGLLDRAGDPESAALSYETAMRLAPGAQVPAIGRAAALQRAGKIDEAVAAAEQARRIPPGGDDPWDVFLKADARFIDQWMIDMRKLRK